MDSLLDSFSGWVVVSSSIYPILVFHGRYRPVTVPSMRWRAKQTPNLNLSSFSEWSRVYGRYSLMHSDLRRKFTFNFGDIESYRWVIWNRRSPKWSIAPYQWTAYLNIRPIQPRGQRRFLVLRLCDKKTSARTKPHGIVCAATAARITGARRPNSLKRPLECCVPTVSLLFESRQHAAPVQKVSL